MFQYFSKNILEFYLNHPGILIPNILQTIKSRQFPFKTSDIFLYYFQPISKNIIFGVAHNQSHRLGNLREVHHDLNVQNLIFFFNVFY